LQLLSCFAEGIASCEEVGVSQQLFCEGCCTGNDMGSGQHGIPAGAGPE